MKIKQILIGLAVLILATIVCSISGANLLDQTGNVLTAQANRELIGLARYQAGTIQNQSNALVFVVIALAVALILALIAGAKIISGLQKGSGGNGVLDQREAANTAPRFISLGPDARSRLKRMGPEQKALLLERLYEVESWIEDDLGYGERAPSAAAERASLPAKWR